MTFPKLYFYEIRPKSYGKEKRERGGKREGKRESDCVRVVLVFVYLWFVCLKKRDREREKERNLTNRMHDKERWEE